ncbi:GerW family sporulation protein [Tepidibacter mesophilus]|uniref:GerW family sporulation protein n=1 Tax=Tepidibacter mesophilus TaxID=655607 RepID=UPI000C0778CD|nr:GerW family sporulation protein [Tepidibacter mesophilus]
MSEQQHPIEALMKTTMENMKEMIDVNTIVGNPVETSNGSVLIPISKVSFGFASGGGEYNKGSGPEEDSNDAYPFAGGTGAGVTVQPVAFMVVEKDETKLMYVDQNANMLDNILNKTPKLMENIQSMFSGKENSKNKSKKEDENKQANEGSKNNKEEN